MTYCVIALLELNPKFFSASLVCKKLPRYAISPAISTGISTELTFPVESAK